MLSEIFSYCDVRWLPAAGLLLALQLWFQKLFRICYEGANKMWACQCGDDREHLHARSSVGC
jgi:hypothetical protein